MRFDEKILELSRTIYETSVIVHTSKMNKNENIDKIKNMIREFIRLEVVPYELTEQEKISFIIENELKISEAISKGHRASDQDEFAETRKKINQYRKELKFIK